MNGWKNFSRSEGKFQFYHKETPNFFVNYYNNISRIIMIMIYIQKMKKISRRKLQPWNWVSSQFVQKITMGYTVNNHVIMRIIIIQWVIYSHFITRTGTLYMYEVSWGSWKEKNKKQFDSWRKRKKKVLIRFENKVSLTFDRNSLGWILFIDIDFELETELNS